MDDFFDHYPNSREIFDRLLEQANQLGPVSIQVTKSQVALRRKQAFAWVWIPARYLRGEVAPLVLTFSFRNRDSSPRWKQIVEPHPGRFTHHLEIFSSEEIDAEVCSWLRKAYDSAS